MKNLIDKPYDNPTALCFLEVFIGPMNCLCPFRILIVAARKDIPTLNPQKENSVIGILQIINNKSF